MYESIFLPNVLLTLNQPSSIKLLFSLLVTVMNLRQKLLRLRARTQSSPFCDRMTLSRLLAHKIKDFREGRAQPTEQPAAPVCFL